MFVTVKLSGDLAENTALSYDAINENWTTATDTTQLIGILTGKPFQDPDDNNNWYGPVTISGQSLYVRADRAIPDEGGFLHIHQGRGYVDNSSIGCGTVAPLNYGATSAVADDLILVHIR
tara:strand:- start:1210 stop:1569 length:360 start_codon:yes stop_codon:yes gene_type:complete